MCVCVSTYCVLHVLCCMLYVMCDVYCMFCVASCIWCKLHAVCSKYCYLYAMCIACITLYVLYIVLWYMCCVLYVVYLVCFYAVCLVCCISCVYTGVCVHILAPQSMFSSANNRGFGQHICSRVVNLIYVQHCFGKKKDIKKSNNSSFALSYFMIKDSPSQPRIVYCLMYSDIPKAKMPIFFLIT